MSRELSDPIDDAALRRLRAYRLDRVRQALESNGLGAVVLFDPCNIRYATGTRNMAVWTLHNHVRCTFVPVQGLPVLFEFGGGRWPVEAETIEIRLLSSGPRTNPWMQECGHRTIEAGDLVAFDTDMIGPHGYCADISRTYLCGPGAPTAEQRRLYRLSFDQIAHNRGLFQPGRTLRDVVENEWPIPEEFSPYRYGLAHGVGLKDEYPFLPNREDLDRLSDPDQVIEPGMVFSLESYIGAVGGREGVKLEDQILITEDGPELLSGFPFEDGMLT